MNLNSSYNTFSKLFFRIAIGCLRLGPKAKSQSFKANNKTDKNKWISKIYIINLNRHPSRLVEMKRELNKILDSSGNGLWSLAERFEAFDGANFGGASLRTTKIKPNYTLADQLFVEPQPQSLPNQLELSAPIEMSPQEIAIARSHIDIWERIANDNSEYALVLEDDIWFQPGFARQLDQAWNDLSRERAEKCFFDILYASYEEVKFGAPKCFLTKNIFSPKRGLWHLSGYIVSRRGANKLLNFLPCQGPIDLWINHKFSDLEVIATRTSKIRQRRDINSSNTYSILPSLTSIGAITSEVASLFQIRPTTRPVFAFGIEESGLSSLAMALSMLGYRCCSDLSELPEQEHESLLNSRSDRIFDAYVNINSLQRNIREMMRLYPRAKFIITAKLIDLQGNVYSSILDQLRAADVTTLFTEESNKWKIICEHLNCSPPTSSYPEIDDVGQRELLHQTKKLRQNPMFNSPKRDDSPWVIESRQGWPGISYRANKQTTNVDIKFGSLSDSFLSFNETLWTKRNDTFTDNLALFRPSNVEITNGQGISLIIKKEPLGVREFSAGSISTRNKYLFGRFQAVIRASNVPGVVTGFFLHRNSPRQEIDIEIPGNKPNRLIINVFYNPGTEGASFDYGYRGAASYIDLDFDASESDHLFTIEWTPSEIRWLVDDKLVHRRFDWHPTPIPCLPMTLHANAWLSRSKELAGRISKRKFPTSTSLRSVSIQANVCRDWL